MIYKLSKAYGPIENITSKEFINQLNITKLKIGDIHTAVIKKRLIKFKVTDIAGEITRIKILNLGRKKHKKNNYSRKKNYRKNYRR